MDPPEIRSPKKADLLQMIQELPEITAKAPNLIFSAPVLHSATEEDSHTYDTDSEPEPKTIIKPPEYKVLPMRTRKIPRITLVLDLDETLVHSEMNPLPHSDDIFKIKVNQIEHTIYVAYRPGLLKFLKSVCEKFEVVIFTASMKKYAEQVLKALERHVRLRYKFYRDNCVEVKGQYIKDLRILGRDLRKVVIIDNSEQAFSCQPENGILISSWFNDQNDRELEKVHKLLMGMEMYEDVRDFLQLS
jgi:CTD small phosphatase-like protein 2